MDQIECVIIGAGVVGLSIARALALEGRDVLIIEKETFFGCDALQSITLPKGLQFIGVHAFTDCIALPSVALPESIQMIDSRAFNGCGALTSVTLPAAPRFGVRLGEGCFGNCPALDVPTRAALDAAVAMDGWMEE